LQKNLLSAFCNCCYNASWEIPTHEFLKKSGNALEGNYELAAMLLKELHTPLSGGNKVKILVNGEEKFPEVLKALNEAKHHIHIEYYIYENDSIGKEIENILIAKAKEGVQVKFIYDDFGSPSINKKMEIRLKEAGVEVYPFQKVLFYLLANRLNYRNHRKIIVIDSQTAFTGDINISDKYINNRPGRLYWRDTHIRMDGPGGFTRNIFFLQTGTFVAAKKLNLLLNILLQIKHFRKILFCGLWPVDLMQTSPQFFFRYYRLSILPPKKY